MQDPSDPEMAAIEALERAVWDALVSGDAARDDELLAPDFVGLYPDGFATRADHIAQMGAGPSVTRYDLSQQRLLTLAPDVVLLAYHARYLRVGRVDEEEMYVASIWRRSGTGWVNSFSMDTPVGAALP